VLNLLFYAF